MSAYITLMTPMTDQECLLAALADVGFVHSKVEVHDSPVPLVGYEGASRAQTAHLVIRRQYVGSASNDLGFLATPTGFQAIVSDYDQQRYGASWLAQVSERIEDFAAIYRRGGKGKPCGSSSSSGRTDATEPGPDHPAQRCQRPR